MMEDEPEADLLHDLVNNIPEDMAAYNANLDRVMSAINAEDLELEYIWGDTFFLPVTPPTYI